MKNSRNKQFVSFKSPAILSGMMKSCPSASFCGERESPLHQASPHCTHPLPISHGVAISSTDRPPQDHSACAQVTLWQLPMVSQCLRHSPPSISSERHCFLSHDRKSEYSKMRYFQREGDPPHLTFITVHCCNGSILLLAIVVHLLLCLIYKSPFIIGTYV